MYKKIIFVAIFLSVIEILYSQNNVTNYLLYYFDYLTLRGELKRPYLSYRTASDLRWDFSKKSENTQLFPWNNAFINKEYDANYEKSLLIYNPDIYLSYNSTYPYGFNDSSLWQGRGMNALITSGLRYKKGLIEVVLKPEVVFIQNTGFTLMPSNYDSPFGYYWGYGHNVGIDAPQRFGSSPITSYSFGDSEIRITYGIFTFGFGTQNVWLGPSTLFPLLHSTNPTPYPKVDFGIKPTSLLIPFLNWNAGTIEFRIWTGYLTESDFFDQDPSNDHNMFHGMSFSYAPAFVPGLVLGFHRTCLVRWKMENLRYILPSFANTYVGVPDAGEDQKGSFTLSWLFPESGFELYGEIGVDDSAAAGIKYPFHTMTYTLGIKKAFNFSDRYSGIMNIELNNTEMSQDFQFQWPYNFGFHHQIKQGYTNKGQFIGSGIGYGGNSQYISFTAFYPGGLWKIFMHRYNPDNNYLYKDTINTTYSSDFEKTFVAWKTILAIGIGKAIITKYFITGVNIQFLIFRNPQYNLNTNIDYGFRTEFGLKYNLN